MMERLRRHHPGPELQQLIEVDLAGRYMKPLDVADRLGSFIAGKRGTTAVIDTEAEEFLTELHSLPFGLLFWACFFNVAKVFLIKLAKSQAVGRARFGV